jgi:hypothetical protein
MAIAFWWRECLRLSRCGGYHRIRKKLSIEGEPENRALQVLFMATSPLGIEPVLDFEAEEGRILEATARQPLALVVQESGCLTELGYLIDDYGKGAAGVSAVGRRGGKALFAGTG